MSAKLTMEELNKIAEDRNGTILINDYYEYKDSKQKIGWRCNKSHEWKAPVSSITNRSLRNGKGSWCPVCSKKEMRLKLKRKRFAFGITE